MQVRRVWRRSSGGVRMHKVSGSLPRALQSVYTAHIIRICLPTYVAQVGGTMITQNSISTSNIVPAGVGWGSWGGLWGGGGGGHGGDSGLQSEKQRVPPLIVLVFDQTAAHHRCQSAFYYCIHSSPTRLPGKYQAVWTSAAAAAARVATFNQAFVIFVP